MKSWSTPRIFYTGFNVKSIFVLVYVNFKHISYYEFISLFSGEKKTNDES